MPSSGERLALEARFHPKSTYWDRFADSCRAVHIHPDDFADKSAWIAPDESHLDFNDAVRFTHALVNEMIERRVVRGPQTRAE